MKLQRPSIVLLILLVGFPQLSETIYSPALPTIADQLQVSNSLVQWTLSIYFVGFALGVFLWGCWSDRVGRRYAMLAGIACYCVGNIIAGLAPCWSVLMLARFVQALGASAGSVVTQAMMREVFSGKERQRLFATISMALALAPALGPVLGGYLTQWFDWRANFAALLLMGAALWAHTWQRLPETRTQVTTISVTVVAKRMLLDKHIWYSAWMVAVINAILFGFYAEGPFMFIDSLGFSPANYGCLGILIALASVLGCWLSRRLSLQYAHHYLIRLGVVLVGLGASALLLSVYLMLSYQLPTWSIVGLLMLPIGCMIVGGYGMVVPMVLHGALVDYQEVLGRAGAVLGLIYYLMLSALLGLLSILHAGSFWTYPAYCFGLALSMLVLV